MERVIFNAYKIADRLPLLQISTHFDLRQEADWKESLKLDEKHVEKVLAYTGADRAVYLYKYGCAAFVNCSRAETDQFLTYLGRQFVMIDARALDQFNETHVIIHTEDGYVRLWEDSGKVFADEPYVNDAVAAVLAKSTELHKIEQELSDVLDIADKYIGKLGKGSLIMNARGAASTIAKSIRFKYRSIENVRLLDRPSAFNKTMGVRQVFDKMSDYFELASRYGVLSNQIGILDSITEEYFSLGGWQSERRLILFEVLLLLIFPLLHILAE